MARLDKDDIQMLGEANDTPPKTPKKTRAPRGTAKTKQLEEIEESLTQLFAVLGASMYAIPFTRDDAPVVLQGGPRLAKSLCDLAKTDRRVFAALKSLQTGSAWGGVVFASAAIVVPIAANHGLLPPMFAVVADLAEAAEDGSEMPDLSDIMDKTPPLADATSQLWGTDAAGA